MKKRYLLAGSLAFLNYFTRAQQKNDSVAARVKQVDIELVYNQYFQDGSHSAVTGGEGTEKLTVYGPQLNITGTNGNHSIGIQTGIDVISSASTDNIDFVESSASRLDARTYLNGTYTHYLANGLALSANLGFSVESDYSSLGYMAGVAKENEENLSSWFFRLQIYNDDLRWGRFNDEYGKPSLLIYPVELRYKEWYDTYRRNSYNLTMGYTRVISQRTTLGIFYEFDYQEGLLATPFHRIIFSDGTKAVELFPEKRLKSGLSVRIHNFAGGNVILRNHLQAFADDFGVIGLALENETVIKLNLQWQLIPNLRVYLQDGSKYFAPYGEHDPDASFYTSDYDLSDFYTITAGTGFNYLAIPEKINILHLRSLLFRYSFMYRQDGLNSHIMTLAFRFQKSGKRERRSK